jgi:hypothetical protein
MTLTAEDFGMSMGSPIPGKQLHGARLDTIVLDDLQEQPEDAVLLSTEIAYTEGGYWHTVQLNRRTVELVLTHIGKGSFPIFEDREIKLICLCTIEGEECNIRYIYDFIIQQWRLE